MATPIIIRDAQDPLLAPFTAVRERDLVGREGRFIAEGEVVLRVLLDAAGFLVETVLISARVAAGGRNWLDAIPESAPLLVASDDIIAEVSGFHVHRGILAVGRRRTQPELADLLATLPARALVLVCIGIANHDNIGGLFRNAAAFGVAAVLCDATCCDPLYRKAIRVSVGGVFKVPFVRAGTAAALLDALTAANIPPIALSPSGEQALQELEPASRLALVLGAEGPGLPEEVLKRTETVRIAMADGFDSLNVATSAGIALHHLFNR